MCESCPFLAWSSEVRSCARKTPSESAEPFAFWANLNEKASAHVSDADIASGQDQINERDQGGSDTGRNEEIVGVDIVHGIEPWMGCLSHGLISTADGTEKL
jgi:hypothetical protein